MDTPNDLGEDPLLLEDIDVEKPQQLQPIINAEVVIEMPVVEDELDDTLESIEDKSSFAVESLEDANMPIDTLETLGQDIGNLELIDSDTVPANETIPEDDTFQDFKKLLDVYLESYDQKQVEDIKGTVETIEAAIDECNQLTEQSSDEEKILVVQNLRHLCLELFNSLDIEYDEKTIYQFLESIILIDSVIHATLTNEMSIKELNYLGTREYKPSDDVISLIGLKQQDSKPYLALGQYMLQMCLV